MLPQIESGVDHSGKELSKKEIQNLKAQVASAEARLGKRQQQEQLENENEQIKKRFQELAEILENLVTKDSKTLVIEHLTENLQREKGKSQGI